MKRQVTLSLPLDPLQDTKQTQVLQTTIEQADPSPYISIEQFQQLRPNLGSGNQSEVTKPVALRDIISVHNDDGMRDVRQMDTMINKVKRGVLVLHSSGLPNTRLVMAPNGRWLLFDGHHTTLAYMIAGKKWLHELPYLTVTNDGQPLDPAAISYFFPPANRDNVISDWLAYTVNWQKKPGEQLEKRQQLTMGELLDNLPGRP